MTRDIFIDCRQSLSDIPATEIMLYGWPRMRELSKEESKYWDNHILPTGCSIIKSKKID